MFNLDQRAAGVLLHVTSLPGPHGIGDFGPEAFRFVDWLKDAGQTIWQWLPVNPIGPGNSPYQSVSAFAGSPLMVALEGLVANGWLKTPVLPEGGFDAQRVEFGKVVDWRNAQLRKAYAGYVAKNAPAERAAKAEWAKQEAYWLDDYALFMALETAHGGRPWWNWAPALRDRDPKALAAARAEHGAEIGYWTWVQWCFDTQASALKRYANERGIAVMGDLPIYIAHHSADCWARPDLYVLDGAGQPTVVAGCPPDAMAPTGQRWGNPIYRWDRMAAEGFAWWSDRVRRALGLADVFRIDHFRGFAGYYEIPASCPTAEEGQWVPGPGKALFDAIEKALGPLPIVAEDLGLITPDVIELRDRCGFPGMGILQFAFGLDATDPFLPHNLKRACVAYTGTHDNDTVRGWWDSAAPRERRFAGSYLPASEHDVHWAMIRACSNSVANFAVFPLQDVLGLDATHRMNIPGTMGDHNWSWRFAWPMVDAEATRVLGLITAVSGRGPWGLSRVG